MSDQRKNTRQVKNTKKERSKKKKKKMTPFLKLLCFVVICFSAWLLYGVAQEVYTTITLRDQLADAQAKLQEVQDENTRLTTEKEKLEDPDYVASYARGNYLLSKDDEQIFYLPEDDNR